MASIEKRGKNSYRLLVELSYDAKGNRIRKRKTIKVEQKFTPKKLREHLELELARFRMEVEAGEYISPEKMTVSQFISDWQKNMPKNIYPNPLYRHTSPI